MASDMLPSRRAWRLLWVLQGHAFDGLRLAQVAKALDCSPTVALRLLETAADEGVAERIAGREDRWRLTPKLTQTAFAHQADVERARARLAEMGQRFTRTI